MSNEIKIKQDEIEQALSKLESSTNALHTSFSSSIGGNNVLTAVLKWNDLNQALEQVVESYKGLLRQNGEATRQSVQFMADSDKQLSSHKIMR